MNYSPDGKFHSNVIMCVPHHQRLAKTIRLPDEDDEVARMEAAAKVVGERKMAAMRRGAEKSPGRPPPPSLM